MSGPAASPEPANQGAPLASTESATAPLASHIVYDIWTLHFPAAAVIEGFLSACAEAIGAHVLKIVTLPFPNGAVTGVAILAESHIAIHTWPERGCVTLDIFSCSPATDPEAVLGIIGEYFRPTATQLRRIDRGNQQHPLSVTSGDIFIERAPHVAEERAYPIDGPVRTFPSKHQRIDTFTSPGLGHVLALDGVVQVTQLDAYVYHELISHPALCAHHSPSIVVIIGGGDGHALIEVLKHEAVTRVYVLELDSEVIAAAKEIFPGARAAFEDSRVIVHIGDGMVSLADLPEVPDIIIGDLTDPVGQAARFATQEFFTLASQVLGPDGILVTQNSSVHYHPELVLSCLSSAQQEFGCVRLLSGAMATYPGAWWTFLVCAKAGDPRNLARTPELVTRLYRTAVHSWFFIPDEIVGSILGSAS